MWRACEKPPNRRSGTERPEPDVPAHSMTDPKRPFTERLTLALQRHAWAVLLVLAALTGWSLWGASKLTFTADFKELLPRRLQSVTDLDKINERVGGSGNFVVVVEGKNVKAAQAYAEALVAHVQEKMPPGLLRYADYNNSDQRAFFEKNKYLYAETKDLEEVHDRLKKKIDFELTCKNAFFFDLTGQCKKDPGFDMGDLQAKYKRESARYDHFQGGYYTNKDGTLLAILFKPAGDASSITRVRQFLGAVFPLIAEIDPKSFDPSLAIHFTGNYRQADEEYSAMLRDVTSTGILALALVLASIAFYFRNLRVVGFIAATAVCGMAWSYGLAYLFVGVLTSQTAFMGSIILGNGINNAIIFLARYLEERRAGILGPEDACAVAASTTIGATFTAAFTTVAAFLALHIAEFRAFREFGLIGGAGMALCWIATYTLLPCLIASAERVRPLAVKPAPRPVVTDALARLVAGRPRAAAWAGVLLSVLGVAGSVLFWRDPFEHDYSNIRSAQSLKYGSAFWNKRIMDEIFELSITPNVVIAESRPQAEEIRQALIARRDANPRTIIDTVRTLDSFVPPEQQAKLEWMGKIRKLLEGEAVKFLTPEQREEIDKIKDSFDLQPVSDGDVPESVRRHFREKDGTLGRLVYVFPRNDRYLWIVENGLQFSEEVKRIELPDRAVVTTSGEGIIMTDILQGVHRDAPKVIWASFLAVLALLLFKFRRPRLAGEVYLPLLLAYLWMGFFMYALKIRITFLNFIVLPMAIGIGIDYSVNIFHRYELDGEGSIENVLRTTGGAVLLCSLTTTIGYLVLLVARSQAMVSFGKLGLLSELCTVSSAVILAPALLILREQRRRKA